jgi:hypothetical protein
MQRVMSVEISGPEVLVLDDALALAVARDVAAEAHREVLQLALAALVADRAVERVVDEQELHRRLLGSDGLRRAREDLHAFGTGVAQAGSGFGAFSTSTRHMRQLAAIDSFS